MRANENDVSCDPAYNDSTTVAQILSPLQPAFSPCIHNQTTLHADGSHDALTTRGDDVFGCRDDADGICASRPLTLVSSRAGVVTHASACSSSPCCPQSTHARENTFPNIKHTPVTQDGRPRSSSSPSPCTCTILLPRRPTPSRA